MVNISHFMSENSDKCYLKKGAESKVFKSKSSHFVSDSQDRKQLIVSVQRCWLVEQFIKEWCWMSIMLLANFQA